MTIELISILIPLLPLAGAALIGVVGLRGLRDRSHWLAILGVGAALVLAVLLYEQVQAIPESEQAARYSTPIVVYEWFRAAEPGTGWFNVELRVDPLTCVMLLTVLSVSLLVVIYSVGYMRDHHGHAERGYERFFAFLCLFVFSMCMLVLGGNFVLLYLGWELVGLCSYLLIGFYYQRPSAAEAAKKAFLVNRVGDFGFGLGILLIYYHFGRLDYAYVFEHVGELMKISPNQVTIIALLLFCGAVGKSAQLPLHVWLPDAMEGPTPVSALIHAATMVTAGVYMVARCGAIFAESALAMAVVALVGGLTALFAATIALAQYDMKRILAYSTISQLGYMFLGLGVGAMSSAIFHLFTHAYFKALLFLGAGSVMHAMAGEIDIRRFGGLRRGLPWTYRTFLIGSLALAGFPLLSGFWSKDEIIHAAFAEAPPLGVLALLTALLTAFYTFRMVFRAFHGDEKLPEGVEHAHESGTWMVAPLCVLSIGAIAAGFVGVPAGHGTFHHFLSPVVHGVHHEEGGLEMMIVSGTLALIGIGAAWFVYVRRRDLAVRAAAAMPHVFDALNRKYYVDELYDALVVGPLRRLGRFCYGWDTYAINGLLWLIAAVPRAVGYGLTTFQRGALQGYAMGMTIGLLLLMCWMLWANGRT
ncbi:MAG: NADH-quinone oxidoreductase subunit L [Phycisphaerae bacterium]|nr:NADH-quinone oxidoreductase subunit L [Phycisphaerae bacterium]NUQ44849.1 NADH-quinone oxidoreductase subunit L [Phycisphaerae bacterium]